MLMPVTAIEFTSPSGVCRAWHAVADTDVLAGPQGRPVVVMAHGVGGTVDSGLLAVRGKFVRDRNRSNLGKYVTADTKHRP